MSNEVAPPTEHESIRSSELEEKSSAVSRSREALPYCKHFSNSCDLYQHSPQRKVPRGSDKTNSISASAGDEKLSLKPTELDPSSGPTEDESAYTPGDTPKKNRGLLYVPSRSSSHKIQPSPTSTGLSGATVSDPTDSVGDGSRESNASITGKRRNGSVVTVSSKKSGAAPGTFEHQTGKVNATGFQSAQMKNPKKSRGLLSFLNCCSAPDNANGVDSEEAVLPVKQVAKIPLQARVPTSKPGSSALDTSAGQSSISQTEKEVMVKNEPALDTSTSEGAILTVLSTTLPGKQPPMVGWQGSSRDTRNQPLPAIPHDAKKPALESETQGGSSPSVFVQAPSHVVPQVDNTVLATSQDVGQHEDNTIVDVANNDTRDPKAAKGVSNELQPNNSTQLPPPPAPNSESSQNTGPAQQDTTAADAAEEKQQWLLPPIEPRFHGKKCLVLDLDETLVHSSFKVCMRRLAHILADPSTDPTSSRFYYSS
jgi:RNA polymerase II subunit A small phosphatase-like protein